MTIVTLIHGTFARNAAWATANSPLATELSEKIRDRVQIETFQWSGRNLHSARVRGADQLRDHIERISHQHPRARHFLIAHSHGGNVALYALKDVEVLNKVTGLVCLSTPFIQTRERDMPAFPHMLAMLIPWMVAVFGIQIHYFPDSSFFGFYAPVAVGGVVIGDLVRRAARRMFLIPKWCPFAEGLKESLRLPELNESRILILRAPGDEASALLSSSAFIAYIFGRLYAVSTRIDRLGMKLIDLTRDWSDEKHWGMCGITLLAAIAAGVASDFAGEWQKWLIFLGVFPLTFLAFVFMPGINTITGLLVRLLYFIIATPLLFLSSAAAFFFGADLGLFGAIVEFSAESTPVGRFSVINLKAPTASGLWHSLPYSDREAFEAIIDWLNDGTKVKRARKRDPLVR